MRIPSWLLVALPFALIGALLLTASPAGDLASSAAAVVLCGAGALVGLAALTQNRPGNFNIRPELKPHALLATTGIYRWVRHPMYGAVLLAMLGVLALDLRPWRALLGLALLFVLIGKLQREERYLLQRFDAYAAYRARSWRLLPGVW